MPRPVTVKLSHPVSSVRVQGGEPEGPSPAELAAEMQRVHAEAERQLAEARAELGQARQALEAAAADVARLRDEVLAEAEDQLLDLAVDIARKVLSQEISAGRHEVEPIVKEALSRVPSGGEVVVYLSPDDLERCPAAGDGGTPGVRFAADPGLRPGACRVETQQGVIESSPEGQLREISEALKAPQ